MTNYIPTQIRPIVLSLSMHVFACMSIINSLCIMTCSFSYAQNYAGIYLQLVQAYVAILHAIAISYSGKYTIDINKKNLAWSNYYQNSTHITYDH